MDGRHGLATPLRIGVLRRVLVLGASGFFGALAAHHLRDLGVDPVTAARRPGAGLLIDAENPVSLRRTLQAGDVVVDAAGPFQARTPALVEAAVEVGFDVVDLSDSLGYAKRVFAWRQRIEAAGIRILSSCSAVSAITATLVRLSGIGSPARVATLLNVAARRTANRATVLSLLSSLGRPIEVWRGGRLTSAIGWRESRQFRLPDRSGVRGFLTESADALTLPEAWPALRDVDFWVDPQMPLLTVGLSTAAHAQVLTDLLACLLPAALTVGRTFGSTTGGFAVDVEDDRGQRAMCVLQGGEQSHLVAIAPAVLAASALARGQFEPSGLVRADQQVQPEALLAYLRRFDVTFTQARA